MVGQVLLRHRLRLKAKGAICLSFFSTTLEHYF